MGARSSSMANISSLLLDFWSAENNPAGVAHVKIFGAGISYESAMLIQEMSYRSALFAMPTEQGTFGLSISQYGYDLYNENKVGLSYGLMLSENFSMGIQLNYLNTQIAESYGSTSGFTGNIGMHGKLSDEIRVAAVIILSLIHI